MKKAALLNCLTIRSSVLFISGLWTQNQKSKRECIISDGFFLLLISAFDPSPEPVVSLQHTSGYYNKYLILSLLHLYPRPPQCWLCQGTGGQQLQLLGGPGRCQVPLVQPCLPNTFFYSGGPKQCPSRPSTVASHPHPLTLVCFLGRYMLSTIAFLGSCSRHDIHEDQGHTDTYSMRHLRPRNAMVLLWSLRAPEQPLGGRGFPRLHLMCVANLWDQRGSSETAVGSPLLWCPSSYVQAEWTRTGWSQE